MHELAVYCALLMHWILSALLTLSANRETNVHSIRSEKPPVQAVFLCLHFCNRFRCAHIISGRGPIRTSGVFVIPFGLRTGSRLERLGIIARRARFTAFYRPKKTPLIGGVFDHSSGPCSLSSTQPIPRQALYKRTSTPTPRQIRRTIESLSIREVPWCGT